jgi:hypothetical protein
MTLNTISLGLVGKTNKGIKTHLGRLGQKGKSQMAQNHTISPHDLIYSELTAMYQAEFVECILEGMFSS